MSAAEDRQHATGSTPFSDRQGIGGDPEKRRHFSLLRSFAPADFITLGNASAGMGTAFAALGYLQNGDRGLMWIALSLPFVALVCDILDGSVARWSKRSSPFGQDLDSLADIVSFGVAPAILGYCLGLDKGLDLIFLTYFVCCGIARLARFNVTAEALTTGEGKVSHFEGTPIPSSVLLVVLWAIAFATGSAHDRLWGGTITVGALTWHPLSLVYAVSGTLMVTASLKIPKP